MRKAALLSDQGYASNMRIIIPTAIHNGRTCTNGTHNFPTLHSKCSYCGFNKLTVSGTMLKPFAAGSTKAITASANSTCYRMAICITYNGQNNWTEYTVTNQLSKTYTFANPGLYTIKIVARDIDPSNADSVTATHTFKIRVY